MSLQRHNPKAKALEGDDLYTVTLQIGQIGASSPREAAEIFWRILDENWDGLLFEVEDGETKKHDVWIDGKDLR